MSLLRATQELERELHELLDLQTVGAYTFTPEIVDGNPTGEKQTFYVNTVPPKENNNSVTVCVLFAGASQEGQDLSRRTQFTTFAYRFYIDGLENSDIVTMMELVSYISESVMSLGRPDVFVEELTPDEISDTYNIQILTTWNLS